jgi:hypothetical protein
LAVKRACAEQTAAERKTGDRENQKQQQTQMSARHSYVITWKELLPHLYLISIRQRRVQGFGTQLIFRAAESRATESHSGGSSA